jgi:hypothetical protein
MKEDIIRMAREAGLGFLFEDHLLVHDELERFASLVVAHALVEPCCQQFDKCQKVCMPRAAAAEREACAAIARQWDADHPASNYGGCIANLIEARGQDAS